MFPQVHARLNINISCFCDSNMNCAQEWGYLMVKNEKKLGNLIIIKSFMKRNTIFGIIIVFWQRVNLPSLFFNGRKS